MKKDRRQLRNRRQPNQNGLGAPWGGGITLRYISKTADPSTVTLQAVFVTRAGPYMAMENCFSPPPGYSRDQLEAVSIVDSEGEVYFAQEADFPNDDQVTFYFRSDDVPDPAGCTIAIQGAKLGVAARGNKRMMDFGHDIPNDP